MVGLAVACPVESRELQAERRVLIVGNFLSQTIGTRGVCEDLASRLAARGWSVLTASQKLNRFERLFEMVNTVWRERRNYSVAQVDVYSGRAFTWAEIVCWALRKAGKPYVLTLHGGNLPEFAHRWPGRVRRLLQSAAVVTTPSRFLLEEMRRHRSDLRLLPNAVDLSKYRFRLRKRPRPRLVWLRAFHRIYNPVLAVEVVGLLARDFPGIQLSMAGPDKADGSLQAVRDKVDQLGIGHQVKLAGKLDKAAVPEWLGSGDIFLNTTFVDNAPVSVVEAMACGLCVVSTNVGGIPHLLADGSDALLVSPADPTAMARAVRRVLEEPGLGESLSAKARSKAETFSWDRVTPIWEALLEAHLG